MQKNNLFLDIPFVPLYLHPIYVAYAGLTLGVNQKQSVRKKILFDFVFSFVLVIL